MGVMILSTMLFGIRVIGLLEFFIFKDNKLELGERRSYVSKATILCVTIHQDMVICNRNSCSRLSYPNQT